MDVQQWSHANKTEKHNRQTARLFFGQMQRDGEAEGKLLPGQRQKAANVCSALEGKCEKYNPEYEKASEKLFHI